jgi:hypothetical protein
MPTTACESFLLKSITDNGGNAIVIILYDAEGNPDPRRGRGTPGTCFQKYVDYEHDAFNRLWKVLHPGDGAPTKNTSMTETTILTNFSERQRPCRPKYRLRRPGPAGDAKSGRAPSTTGLDHDAADNPTAGHRPGAEHHRPTSHDDLGDGPCRSNPRTPESPLTPAIPPETLSPAPTPTARPRPTGTTR